MTHALTRSIKPAARQKEVRESELKASTGSIGEMKELMEVMELMNSLMEDYEEQPVNIRVEWSEE